MFTNCEKIHKQDAADSSTGCRTAVSFALTPEEIMTTMETAVASRSTDFRTFDLHVMVTRRGMFWIAQGVEVDYEAQGTSWLEVRKAFEDGFKATAAANLRRYGTLEHFFKEAPQRIRDEFDAAKRGDRHSQTRLPLDRVRTRADVEFVEVLAA